MNRVKHVLWPAILLLTACSGAASKSVDLSTIPMLEITATHAIAIEQSASGLSFVPNNVAPWLGRLVLVNSDLSLSSTDIEGRTTQIISELEYRQTFGLARENAPGVFLALNDDTNKLEAFIESDDQGNFNPLSYSGGDLTPRVFCSTNHALQDSASVIIALGGIKTLSFAIPDQLVSVRAPVEQSTVLELNIGDAPAKHCTVGGANIFAYTDDGNQAYVHTYKNQNADEFDITEVVAPTNISAMAQLVLNDKTYLLMLNNEDVYLFNTETGKLENKLIVKSGLSIGGLKKTKFISATSHNFGGSAFSEGLVAFGQADEDRVVFVSLSYLAGVLEETNS